MILADDPDQIRRALRLTGKDAGVILRSSERPRSSQRRPGSGRRS
jgi:hypothetical protein